jgi:hypothetical protein
MAGHAMSLRGGRSRIANRSIVRGVARGKVGAFKPKIRDEVLERRPRSDVQNVEFDKGALKGALKIQFADGGMWEFEIPKVHRKTTERVVQELTPG